MCRRQNKADEHDGKEDIPQAEERHGQCGPAEQPGVQGAIRGSSHVMGGSWKGRIVVTCSLNSRLKGRDWVCKSYGGLVKRANNKQKQKYPNAV